MKQETLTAKKFDNALADQVGASPFLWGAKAIGKKIGRSPGYVRRTLAQAEGTPVRKDSAGQFYAIEDELLKFFGAMSR